MSDDAPERPALDLTQYHDEMLASINRLPDYANGKSRHRLHDARGKLTTFVRVPFEQGLYEEMLEARDLYGQSISEMIRGATSIGWAPYLDHLKWTRGTG